MQQEYKVVVLISGRGSNMEALLKNQGYFKIVAVLSDNPNAAGLEIARNAGVPIVQFFAREKYSSKSEQKLHIYNRIREIAPDLICLAGFMQIIEGDFVNEFYGKIINIHPSLLPELAGLDTHRRALEEKKSEHGCTVHFVDSGMDTGPIIAQARCAVLAGEDENALAARVLGLEHKIYSWVVDGMARREIWLEKMAQGQHEEVKFAKGKRGEGMGLGFETVLF